jgi:hypothetical protein
MSRPFDLMSPRAGLMSSRAQMMSRQLHLMSGQLGVVSCRFHLMSAWPRLMSFQAGRMSRQRYLMSAQLWMMSRQFWMMSFRAQRMSGQTKRMSFWKKRTSKQGFLTPFRVWMSASGQKETVSVGKAGVRDAGNPNGIPELSPGLPAGGYPGSNAADDEPTLKGLKTRLYNPFRVGTNSWG